MSYKLMKYKGKTKIELMTTLMVCYNNFLTFFATTWISAVHRSRRAGAGAGVLTYFAGAGAGAGVCSPPVKL